MPTSSKARPVKSEVKPPVPVEDPIPGVSMEYMANAIDQFAVHLWHAKNAVPNSPQARVYRIALEHLQTAALWLKTVQ
jgi:hypothetical protein